SDERTITILPSQEGAIGLLGKLLSPRKTGPLSTALESAAGKDHLVAAIDLSQLPRVPADALPPELRVLRPVLDAKSATLIGNLAEKNADLELRLAFANKDDAKDGKAAIDEGRQVLVEELANQEKRLSTEAKERALELTLIKEFMA